MKFKTSTLALTATLAAGLASSAFADDTTTPTSYNKLGFTTNQIYTVSVSGSTITTSESSSWSTDPAPTAKDDVIEIDSDPDKPLRFTPATANANTVNDATELKFNVEASVVPNSVTLADDANAQCGFAIKETIEGNVVSTNFYVYTSTGWKPVSGTVPAAGAMFDLTVKIDYRTGLTQANYLIGSTDLGWHALKASTKGVSNIDFIGNGKLASLRGDVLTVASEAFEVVLPGTAGNVELVVPEMVLKDIATKTDGDAKGFLASTATGTNDKLTNLDRFVLTGATADPKKEDLPKAVAKPFDAGENKLAIKLDNLAESLPEIKGATPTFTLQGSDDKSEWTDITSNQTGAAFVFETSATAYKYYRVKATVAYGSAK